MINTTRLLSLLYITAFIGVGISYGKLYLFHLTAIPIMFSLFLFWGTSSHVFTLPKKNCCFFYFFFGWHCLSLIWSLNKKYTFMFLFYLICGAIILFSAIYWMDNLNKQLRVFKSLTSIVIVDIIFSLFEVFTPFRLPISPYFKWLTFFGRTQEKVVFSEKITEYLNSTPTGFHWNPNNLAAVMIMVLPFFLFSSKKIIRYIGGFIIFILIIASGSRGCFLAYILTLLFWSCAFSAKRAFKTLFLYLPLFLFLGLCLLNIPQIKHFSKISEALSSFSTLKMYLTSNQANSKGNSISVRQYLVQKGMQEFQHTYGLGVGGGASKAIFEKGNSPITSMHNFWIELLVEGGVLAGGGFILWYIWIAIRLYHLYHKSKKIPSILNSTIMYFSGSLSTSMTGFAVAAISPSSVIYVLPMWVMLSFAIATLNNAKCIYIDNINR